MARSSVNSKLATNHRITNGKVRRAKTLALIIQSSIPIFAKNGPDIPVIDDFVKAAGVSRGTFYNYFKTTRELLDASMISLSNDLIDATIPVVEDMSNPLLRIATAARIYYRKVTLDPVLRAFLHSVSGVGTLATERIQIDLQAAMKSGQIRTMDIEIAEAIAVGVMVFSFKSPAALTGGDDRGREVVRSILMALGASSSLIEEALAIPLPETL